jgi:hypothetical protein
MRDKTRDIIIVTVFTLIIVGAIWYFGYKGCMEVFDSVMYCIFK